MNCLVKLTEGSVVTDYGYDANGNLTTASQNGLTRASYEYDVRDQLRAVKDASNQTIASYDYDFERQRLSKTIGLNSIRYVYAGNQVVNEYDDSNRLLNRYDVGANEIIRAEFSGEGERYFFSDALGSTTSLVQTSNNQITARYEYDAFGSFFNTQGSSVNSINFTGQRLDYETGLMPLGNGERYYSSGLGRFIQQDSWTGMAQMAQSMNRYAYSFNNPLRYTDPTGNEPDAVQQWFRESRQVMDNHAQGTWWENAATYYGLGMGQFFYSFGKGVYNTVMEPFRLSADIFTLEVAALMGIDFNDMQFSSRTMTGIQQQVREGKSGLEIATGIGESIHYNIRTMGMGPIFDGFAGPVSDYYSGRITIDEYNERMGEHTGEVAAEVATSLVGVGKVGSVGKALPKLAVESRAMMRTGQLALRESTVGKGISRIGPTRATRGTQIAEKASEAGDGFANIRTRNIVDNELDPLVANRVRRLIKEDDVAMASYRQIQKADRDVSFDFGTVVSEKGITFPTKGTDVTIYMQNNTAKEAVSTMVHESSHVRRIQRGHIEKTLYEEYRAYRREELYESGRRPSLQRRKELYQEVLKDYADRTDYEVGPYPFKERK